MNEKTLLDDQAVYDRLQRLDRKKTALRVTGGGDIPELEPVPWTDSDQAEYDRLHRQYYCDNLSIRTYYNGM